MIDLNSLDWLDSLPPEQQQALLKEANTQLSYSKLDEYAPYQKQRDFHAAGKTHRERLLKAGNQLGKTLSAGAEVAIHVTGRYPEWWDGYVFDRENRWWVAGVTGESTRDNPQRMLYGPFLHPGTGMIPRDAIKDRTTKRGMSESLDQLIIRHGGGGDVQAGESSIGFKSYDQGREKWQGPTLDGIWNDEEPPEDIYIEGMTRTNVAFGPILTTFTPLKGMSRVVKRFLIEKPPGTHVTNMTIFDVDHYSEEAREAIIASYPLYLRKAKAMGDPSMGSGVVFPVQEEYITVPPFQIPEHWPIINGIDFGWDHPTAAVKIAWDRDNDCIYITGAHRAREQTPAMFAPVVKAWGDWIPWSWPHDGHQSGGKFDAKDQQQLASIYRDHGLAMLPTHATFEDGTNGLEPGVMEMLQRMQSGRLKIFSNLNDWFEEFKLYHRKDGLIVKENDDLLSATRYAIMMRRFAIVRMKKQPILVNKQVLGWQS